MISIGDYLKLGLGVLVGLALGSLYNAVWRDSQIAAEARSGYVLAAEAVAAKAQAAELARQQQAASAALDALNARIVAASQAEAEKDAAHEQSIRDYEARLAQEHRSCPLSAADLEWLRRARPAAPH